MPYPVRDAQWAHLITMLDRLKPQQIAAVDAHLAGARERARAVLALEGGEQALPCPGCTGEVSSKWGTTRTGFQRRGCRGCGLTFTARTGTAVARIQRPGAI